jgi:uncharacterized protein YndB with AHSA1/START domain
MTETRAVVVEREIPHPPEKIWRALTQPHLIAEWLMKNDFKPAVGHRFNLRGDWGGVLDCEVLAVEPNRTLSYTWNFAHDDAGHSGLLHWSKLRHRARKEGTGCPESLRRFVDWTSAVLREGRLKSLEVEFPGSGAAAERLLLLRPEAGLLHS